MSATATAASAPARSKRAGLAVRLRRRLGTVGMICAVVLALALFIAIFGRVLAPHDPNSGDLSLAYVGPSAGHPLGFDGQGRDLLSRLLVGAGTAILGPLAVVTLGLVAGTALAVTAAWRRGATDAAVSSGLDIVFSFPGILLVVLAAAVFSPGLLAASIAMAIAYVPYVARVLRSAALKERDQLYILALEVQGAKSFSICLRHLIPNILPLIVAEATIMFGWAMVDLAAVSFLGLGVQPPEANWGVMISENQAGILMGYPLPAVAASACIVVVVVAVNVLGERLMDTAER